MVMVRTKGKSGVYQILNLINGKRYVGSSVDLEGRRCQHFRSLRYNEHPNRHLQYAWNKDGEDSFEFSVLRICPKQKLIASEQEFLDFYNSYDVYNGYNLNAVAGNSLGLRMTYEQRCRISEAHKGQVVTKDQRQKISEAMKKKYREYGRLGNVGWHPSEETKCKMSKNHRGHKGYQHSEESKHKISESRKGMQFSEEHRRRLSESHEGQEPANKGQPLTEEQRRKISQAKKGIQSSKETKHKISEAKKGQEPWNKGQSRTPEIKRKISEAKKRNTNLGRSLVSETN